MIALIYPVLLVVCVDLGGLWYWMLLPFNVALVPLVDHAIARLAPNWRPSAGLQRILFADTIFWLYALLQAAALIYVLVHVSTNALSLFEYMGLASSAGIVTGTAGITAAHELMHRKDSRQRALGSFLLLMVTYMHFRIEHVRGHHRRVGTAHDPGTAKLGESYPAFLHRAMGNGFTSAWQLEVERLRIRGLGALSVKNQMLQYVAIEIAVLVLIQWFFGLSVLAFFLLQSFIAVHLLEGVNYIQHYGLERTVDRSGRASPVSTADAWDSDFRLSELIVFNMTRHGGHHVNPGRTCDRLDVERLSPKLPYSFFAMVFLALFPPIWFRVMDRRVTAFRTATI